MKLPKKYEGITPWPWERSYGRYDVIAPNESNGMGGLYHVCDTSGDNYEKRGINAEAIADLPRLASAVVELREKLKALVDNLSEGDFISITRIDDAKKSLESTKEWEA